MKNLLKSNKTNEKYFQIKEEMMPIIRTATIKRTNKPISSEIKLRNLTSNKPTATEGITTTKNLIALYQSGFTTYVFRRNPVSIEPNKNKPQTQRQSISLSYSSCERNLLPTLYLAMLRPFKFQKCNCLFFNENYHDCLHKLSIGLATYFSKWGKLCAYC